jgi:hypothetical protein
MSEHAPDEEPLADERRETGGAGGVPPRVEKETRDEQPHTEEEAVEEGHS